MALNIEPDMYKATSRPYVGASIIIHNAIDFPDIDAHMVAVPIGHVLEISVTGTSIRGMESLRTISQEKRMCYFHNEVKLCIFFGLNQALFNALTSINSRLLYFT